MAGGQKSAAMPVLIRLSPGNLTLAGFMSFFHASQKVPLPSYRAGSRGQESGSPPGEAFSCDSIALERPLNQRPGFNDAPSSGKDFSCIKHY